MVLKGIPALISPELLMRLCEMGHGDELTIADRNFPSRSIAAAAPQSHIVDLSGHSATAVLTAILQLFPLDQYVATAAFTMQRVPADEARRLPVPIWSQFKTILNAAELPTTAAATDAATAAVVAVAVGEIERFAFYERAKQSYLIIVTGESALYANLILKKGVISGSNSSN